MEKRKKIITVLYEVAIYAAMLTAIAYYRPSPLLYLPLLISVSVMLLQARVNRYAFLVGALNALLYAVSYIQMSLYATALYAAAVSFPLQCMTFFTWKRHTAAHQTSLQKMTGKARWITLAGMAGGACLLWAVFSQAGSPYWILDNGTALLGIVASVLCLLRYAEYAWIQIACNGISLCNFCLMLPSDPSRIIWVIHAGNSIISSSMALRKIHKCEVQNDRKDLV